MSLITNINLLKALSKNCRIIVLRYQNSNSQVSLFFTSRLASFLNFSIGITI